MIAGKRFPVGTRVEAVSGWTGTVVKVLPITSGSGAVRVEWDQDNELWERNPFAETVSVVSNPDLVLKILERPL